MGARTATMVAGFRVVIGLVLLAWTLGALGVTGAAVVCGWHDGRHPGEQAVDAILASAAVAMVVVGLLGMAGVLWPGWVIAIATALAAVSLVVRRGAPLRLWWRAGCAALDGLRASPLPWVLVLLGAACVARGLSIPQLAWDGLTYHATYPATWVQEGRFVPLQGDGTWELYETFPKGIESLAYLTLAFGHRDDLLNLVNLPFWIVTAVATRAALGTLGVAGFARDAWVVIVSSCPVLLAYVTPLYVEVPTAACAMASIAAGARVVARADARGLWSIGLAMGVGLSTKLTLLAWCLPVLVVCLYSVKTFGWWRARAALWGGATLALGIAGPWYVQNMRLCGNPIYPSPLPGFSEGPFAGTSLNEWAMQESSVIGLRATDQVVDALVAAPWRVGYPLGPGWLFVFLFFGAFVIPFFVDDARRRSTALLMTLIATFLLAVYMYTPYNGLYAEADTRFLGPCFLAAALGCAIALGDYGLPSRALVLGVCAAIGVVTCLRTQLIRFPYSAESLVVTVAAVAALGLAVAGAAARGRARRRGCMTAALFAAGLSAAALPSALRAREASRAFAYGLRVDLHPHVGFPRIWASIETLPPSRIALATGRPLAQEGWFFYPLFGADLRHRVRHVPIERDDVPACLVRGMTRDEPDERAWLRRMRDWDYLVVVSEPVELSWVRRHPDRFDLVMKDGTAAMYRVRRSEH
ncbi:MAG: hypothetical protein IT379_40370 [Deltaproteobacteria bacterium]|nr:hypothetical protein [Deltaproteobacteria bacterium]